MNLCRYVGFYPFPTLPMIYSVELNWNLFLDASSSKDARTQVKNMMVKNPEMFIKRVEQGSEKKRSLFHMLVFGV